VRILDDMTSSVAAPIEGDGRISRSQLDRMLKYTTQDPDAEVIGMDSKVRPVIRARLGGSKEPSEFSLLAGGRPTAVVLPLLEEWR
jgi:hypothetical protein